MSWRCAMRTGAPLAGALLAALLICGAAHAQRLAVLTQSLTATRESARVYLHSVDFDGGGILPGVFAVPGRSAIGPLLRSESGRLAAVSTGPAWRGGMFESRHTYTALSGIETVPFQVNSRLQRGSEAGWREWVAALLPERGNAPAAAVMLGFRDDGEGGFDGRLRLAPWPEADTTQTLPAWRLPGRPAELVVLQPPRMPLVHPPPQLAVLSTDTGRREAVLTVCDADGGAARSISLVHPDSLAQNEPRTVALAHSKTDGLLFALLSGYALENGGEVRSWLYCFESAGFQPSAPPLAIRGAPEEGRGALRPVAGGRCWAATRVPGTDFAYATLLRLDERTLVKEEQYALTGVTRAFSLAPAPQGAAVAVATEHRLEIWRENRRGEIHAVYEAPCALLLWTQAGLFLGEGNRLHAVNPETARPRQTFQFQSGWVRDAVVIPPEVIPADDIDGDGLSARTETARRTDPDLPDTDGDGIHDGIDPVPDGVSPRLEVPPEIVFHGEAVGNEVRAMTVGAGGAQSGLWRIETPTPMPWLILYPRGGRAPGMSLLGIEPTRLPPGGAHGTLHVVLQDLGGLGAAGSPAPVHIRVAPVRRVPQQILWIWPNQAGERLRGPNDPRQLGALAEMLAGPPCYFAHREVSGPFQEPLSPYSIVALESAAAARGALAQTTLLDYVAEGGALLFLGGQVDEESPRSLQHWLAPLGVRIDASARVEGRFEAGIQGPLTRHWDQFRIEKGCLIEAEPEDVLVSTDEAGGGAVFAAREYGYGRVALLASATPLTSNALAHEAHRGFAQDLFRWLEGAGSEYRDLDGDGLTDATEDPVNVQVVDPGETDYLNADTDRDGVGDGLEDANRNGRVDDGETDPRNPDSDGDGVLDGADASPCPVFGAPRIAQVVPAQGAAEGGGVVLLRGDNFTPDSVVWFGGRQAQWIEVADTETMVVRVPEARGDGGAVNVRVVTAGGALEGLLPDGFMYEERHAVTLRLTQAGSARRIGSGYEGEVLVGYATGERAPLGRAVLLLAARPPDGFEWVGAARPVAGETSQATVAGQPVANGLYLVDVDVTRTRQPQTGVLLRLRWRYTPGASVPERIQVSIPRCRVTNPSGGAYRVETGTLEISLTAPPRPGAQQGA